MTSESPAKDPGTPNDKRSPTGPPTPPTSQPAAGASGDEAARAPTPQGQQFYFNGEPPHDGTAAEPGGPMPVPFPGMPMFPYAGGPMTKPKRTQCKNACTNCQKACKKCDDNRPCHRCVRYGTTDTCVDSKRKERKKGVKRGPYKKRDSKGQNADAENDDSSGPGSASSSHGAPPNMPYVGPVGYPPGMWSSYTPGAKVEGGGYYQPVFALTPVGGHVPHGGDGENSGGAGEGPPHFPVGFFPATFITYPGPYPPYPMPPPGHTGSPHGFHYVYPPPPGFHPPRPHNVPASNATSEPAAPAAGSTDTQHKDAPDSSATANAEKGKQKDTVTEPQINGKTKLVETVNGTVAKDNE